MGKFRQHVNRKRKERERKRTRKSAKLKFIGECGNESLRTISNSRQKTLAMDSTVSENVNPVSRDRTHRQAPTKSDQNSHVGLDDALSRVANSPMTVDKIQRNRKTPSKVKSPCSRTSLKPDHGSADREQKPLSLKKSLKSRKKKGSRTKRTAELTGEGDGADGGASTEDVKGMIAGPCSPLSKFTESVIPSESEGDDGEEKVENAAELHPAPSFRSGLGNKALQKMRVAQFRMINEMLYTSQSGNAENLFEEDVNNFHVYHEGYRHQVCFSRSERRSMVDSAIVCRNRLEA